VSTTTKAASARLRAILILLVVMSLGAGAWWISTRSANVTDSGENRAQVESTDSDPEPSLDLETIADHPRSTAMLPVEATSEPASTTKELAKDGAVFSGRFRFADGSTPPKLTFELFLRLPDGSSDPSGRLEDLRRAELAGGCHPRAIESTDDHGKFLVDGLCPGSYAMVLTTFSGLGVVDGVYSVPGQDVDITLGGYLLEVHSVDPGGAMLGESVVTGEYLRDPDAGERRSAPAHWGGKSDAHGIAFFAFPAPGRCTFRARKGLEVSEETTILLQGPSRVVDSTLRLNKAGNGAALRLVLHGCAPFNSAITDYCFTISDANSRTQFARICSESAEADGVFRNLPAGTFVLEVVPRYGGAPSFYMRGQGLAQGPVTLIDDRETSVDLCLQLGGRISLLIASDDHDAHTESAAQVTAVLWTSDQTGVVFLSFREPDSTGITVSRTIPLGVRRLTETVIEEGTYFLDVIGDGLAPTRTIVSIRAGETIELSCTAQGRK
jgi:hypothetical protein